MRYALCLLLVALLAGCDGQPAPTQTPVIVSPTNILSPAPTPTAAERNTEIRPTEAQPTLPAIEGVAGPAQRYAITTDDLLAGYRFVSQEQGSNFYSSNYEMDSKFRKFAQTIYLLDSPTEAEAQMPTLLNAFTATLKARTMMPLTEVVSGTIGEQMLGRQYHWGEGGSERGAWDFAFRYQNVVAMVSYSYDVVQMSDAEAEQRARGLMAIILGKLIAH